MFHFPARIILVCTALLGCFLAGCDRAEPMPPRPPDIGFGHRFSLKIGTRSFEAQVALSEIEKTNGLMFRKKLGENEGMLFVFPANGTRCFWMRNVPINIDLAYLTEDGKIDEIFTLFAEDPSSISSRSPQIRYVLEMPEKWFEKTGVKTGDRIDLAGVRGALKARGYAPEQFLPPATER